MRCEQYYLEMKQESNPFSQFVTDPSSIPDPNKMTRTDFLNYTSYEIEKSNAALRMMKKSLPFMAGIIGLSILGMIYA